MLAQHRRPNAIHGRPGVGNASRANRSSAGHSLIELLFTLPLILIAVTMFSNMVIGVNRQQAVNREIMLVSWAVQDVFEDMRNEPFDDVFRLYNPDPFDDPDGPGTAPGNRFRIEGLDALPETEDGLVGEIFMPALNAGSEVAPLWQVREDVDDADLGVPRDLNGDSFIDALDHTDDYTVLPVSVLVRWRGKFGPRVYRMHTLLADFRP